MSSDKLVALTNVENSSAHRIYTVEPIGERCANKPPDVIELAEILGSTAVVRKKLRVRAWELPPRAHGFGELLRWRRAEAERWMFDTGLVRRESPT